MILELSSSRPSSYVVGLAVVLSQDTSDYKFPSACPYLSITRNPDDSLESAQFPSGFELWK